MIKSLWPTKILCTNINDTKAVNSAFSYLVSNYTSDDMPSNYRGNSLADNELLVAETKPIIDYIRSQVEYYLNTVWEYKKEYSLKVYATNHKKVAVHNHSGAQLSGVFYLCVPEGDLVLYDPRYNANRGYPTPVRDIEFPIHTLAVTEGDCVVFPSFLWHESTPNSTTTPRIIMPFDVWITE